MVGSAELRKCKHGNKREETGESFSRPANFLRAFFFRIFPTIWGDGTGYQHLDVSIQPFYKTNCWETHSIWLWVFKKLLKSGHSQDIQHNFGFKQQWLPCTLTLQMKISWLSQQFREEFLEWEDFLLFLLWKEKFCL